MKKTNLIAALAVIALSATSLMAQQVTDLNINTNDYSKELKALMQSDVQNEQLNKQHQIIQNAIRADIESVNKYQALETEYNRFLNLMDNESLTKLPAEAVGQKIFMTIDDLAHAILALPAHAQQSYIQAFTTSKYFFKYNGKVMNLEGLFDLATGLKHVYLTDETPIVKVLNKQQATANANSNPFWQDAFQGIIQAAQTSK